MAQEIFRTDLLQSFGKIVQYNYQKRGRPHSIAIVEQKKATYGGRTFPTELAGFPKIGKVRNYAQKYVNL